MTPTLFFFKKEALHFRPKLTEKTEISRIWPKWTEISDEIFQGSISVQIIDRVENFRPKQNKIDN